MFATLGFAALPIPALIVTVPVIVCLRPSDTYSSGRPSLSHDHLVALGYDRQRPEATDAGSRRRCPDASHPARALGDMATRGTLGMFLGATLPALGYQIFTSWIVPS